MYSLQAAWIGSDPRSSSCAAIHPTAAADEEEEGTGGLGKRPEKGVGNRTSAQSGSGDRWDSEIAVARREGAKRDGGVTGGAEEDLPLLAPAASPPLEGILVAPLVPGLSLAGELEFEEGADEPSSDPSGRGSWEEDDDDDEEDDSTAIRLWSSRALRLADRPPASVDDPEAGTRALSPSPAAAAEAPPG